MQSIDKVIHSDTKICLERIHPVRFISEEVGTSARKRHSRTPLNNSFTGFLLCAIFRVGRYVYISRQMAFLGIGRYVIRIQLKVCATYPPKKLKSS